MARTCPTCQGTGSVITDPCPKCKGDLRVTDKQDGLICDACHLLYPIKDDIPIMLIEEAQAVK